MTNRDKNKTPWRISQPKPRLRFKDKPDKNKKEKS